MTRFCRVFMLLAFMNAGCGDDSVAVTPLPPTDRAKSYLEETAKTGDPIGSGEQELREQFEQIQQVDPAKGERLLKELDELAAMSNSGKIKAKAQAMAAEL